MPIWEIIFFPQMFHRVEIQPLGVKQDSPFSCSRDFAAGGNQAPRCAQAGELGRGRGERQELFFRLNRYGVGSSEPAGDRPRVTVVECVPGVSAGVPQIQYNCNLLLIPALCIAYHKHYTGWDRSLCR